LEKSLWPSKETEFILEKVYGPQRKPSYSMENESESIFSKCGGLPLALTSVSKQTLTYERTKAG
jgi:hypothetical protein